MALFVASGNGGAGTRTLSAATTNSTASIHRHHSSIGGDDGFVMPKLPGQEKDFWEGPQWNTLGFVVEYLWGFGIIFSV
ncbi:hypothetical protein LINPERHAP1_LOCUS31578 [Linum perenne]